MSEEQLSALFAKLKDDAVLLEKLKGAADLKTAQAIAKEAGFDVSEADWLKYQEGIGEGELSDDELDAVAGGGGIMMARYKHKEEKIIKKGLVR